MQYRRDVSLNSANSAEGLINVADMELLSDDEMSDLQNNRFTMTEANKIPCLVDEHQNNDRSPLTQSSRKTENYRKSESEEIFSFEMEKMMNEIGH